MARVSEVSMSIEQKTIFTPGPANTSAAVKAAMQIDLGSRDETFIATVRSIREQLLDLAGVTSESHSAVIMQGSGTFAIESVIGSAVAAEGKLLVLVNGAYGRRIVTIAERLSIPVAVIETAEDQLNDVEALRRYLANDAAITVVAMVHCETTTGIINPLARISELVKAHGKRLIVDAMSSFGAIPIAMQDLGIDFLISSANKCIEGVPGFAFALVSLDALAACQNQARSVSLDLYAQYAGLEKDGQFRFTPPVHTLLAFHQALLELAEEGGVEGRQQRYVDNQTLLSELMQKLGFRPYLPADKQGPMITAFHYPANEAFAFGDFYARLSRRNMVIYPGKLSHVDLFRIGNIGRLYPRHIEELVTTIADVLTDMNIPIPVS
jgi:2-aminoethylphosphonate-pyruvate transaminase